MTQIDKLKEDLVEIVDVWEVEKSGEFHVGKRLISRTANGVPMFVCDGFMTEKNYLTKEEADKIKQMHN